MALIEEIFNLKKKNPIMSLPRLQLMVSNPIYPVEMTTGSAKNHLKTIIDTYAKNGYEVNLPLIFLDEFNVDSGKGKILQTQYTFYRNLIRDCDLIPVLMGTNSRITNMINAGAGSGNEIMIWSYIFYKLLALSC